MVAGIVQAALSASLTSNPQALSLSVNAFSVATDVLGTGFICYRLYDLRKQLLAVALHQPFDKLVRAEYLLLEELVAHAF